jgi:hypothetical protein
MKTPGASYLGLRYAIALAMSTAPFAGVGQAEAACAPTSPVNNTTVTCTGATANQNGTGSDLGNTGGDDKKLANPGGSRSKLRKKKQALVGVLCSR